MENKCNICGKEFKTKSNSQKFCSEECIIKDRKEKYRLNPKRIVKNCLFCGENLIGTPNMRYCYDCRAKARKEHYESMKGEAKRRANIWYKEHREDMFRDRNCWICGKSLKETSCRRFCYACAEKNKLTRYKLKLEIRNTKKYLLKILGGKCFNCGTTKGLNVHHKVRENNLKDLILLCEKCHRKEETKVLKNIPKFTGTLKKEVREKLICEECGSKKSVVIHYKDYNSKNRDTLNLQLLCRKCLHKGQINSGQFQKGHKMGVKV